MSFLMHVSLIRDFFVPYQQLLISLFYYLNLLNFFFDFFKLQFQRSFFLFFFFKFKFKFLYFLVLQKIFL